MSDNEESKKSPKLLPPLMAILIPVFHEYQRRQLAGYYQAAFESLDMIYESLTKKPKAEVKETWEKYTSEYAKIKVARDGYLHRQQDDINRARNNFLRKNNNRIYGCFIEALDKHGYFEQLWQLLTATGFAGMQGETEEGKE